MGMIPGDDERLNLRPRAFEQSGEDAAKHEARQQFFEVVHLIEPRVSGDLLGEPLELYRPLFFQALDYLPEDKRTAWRMWKEWDGVVPSWPTFKYAIHGIDPLAFFRLRGCLEHWSWMWRLTDYWCLEAAIETLMHVSADGDDPAPRPLVYPGVSMIEMPFNGADLRFEFSHKGWSPTLESWESAAEWLGEGFERALQEYKARVEHRVAGAGLLRVRQERHRKGDPMEWLARSVVGREKYSEIGRSPNRGPGAKATRQAVSAAVHRQAQRIGLTLPKDDETLDRG